MADAVEIQNLKDQVQDYSEKLDVVKSKKRSFFKWLICVNMPFIFIIQQG